MTIAKSCFAQRVILGGLLAGLLAVSLACAGGEPTPTPVPPRPTAPPAAPTAAPAPTATRVPPTPAPVVTGKPVYGGTLRFARALDIKNLDPLHRADTYAQLANFALYNTLVYTDENFNIIPELAQSWDFSSDGKAITLHLVKGAKYQDGTPFNAQAAKWFFDKILDPKFGANIRPSFEGFVTSVEVVDEQTVTLRLTKPYRPLIATLATSEGQVISPSAWEKYGDKDFGRNPTGTGSFKLKEWVPGSHLLLVRNDDYWDKGKPYLDSIKWQNAVDRSVQLAMIRTGETDVVDDIYGTDLPILKGNPSVKIPTHKSGRWWGLSIDVNKEPWSKKALRQAVAYSIDKKTFVDTYLAGHGRVAHLPEGSGWWSDESIVVYEYSLQKAKEKLAEAGYPNGITFDYWCMASDVELRACEIIQAMMKKVEISTTIIPVAAANYWADIVSAKLPFSRTGYFPRPDPDIQLRKFFHSKGYWNSPRYNSPKLDSLLDQAAGIYDTKEARKIYLEVQRMAIEDVIYVPVYREDVFAALNVKVQNWVWIPDTLARLRDLWLTK